MAKFLRSLEALPIPALARQPDVLLAAAMSLVLVLFIVPVPAFVLDILIPLNLALAVLILLGALFAETALDLGTFPTMLLVTTLFRLALNVSTTRRILAYGDAGRVVHAFGSYVVQGDLIVGLVVFLVLALVQFIVIAKGAERVAEVGARFTLDALPGKQMAIEAALRAGAISEEEAQAKRSALQRESQLFGNLDGAMKFVKGDAIAGLVLVVLNLVAGLLVGVVRLKMPIGDAIDVFSILSVGDGLVSQLPALLITLAAGILVTRVSSRNPSSNLGKDMQSEFFSHPKVLVLGGVLIAALGLLPGLPLFGFLLIGTAIVGLQRWSTRIKRTPEPVSSVREKLKAAMREEAPAACVVAIQLDLDPQLTTALGLDEPGSPELVAEYLPQIRDAIFNESGVHLPAVRVCAGAALPRDTFVVRIKGVPIHQGTVACDRYLAMAAPERLRRLGVIAQPALHPLSQTTVSLITEVQRVVLEASGIPVWSPAGVVALELAAVLRARIREFIGLHEVAQLIEQVEKAYPTLVREVVPKVVSMQTVTGVLKRLVEEQVSIQDAKTIFESLGEYGRFEQDEVALTERVRIALANQLSYAHAGMTRTLHAIVLSPVIEDTVRAGLHHAQGGLTLTLEPEIGRALVAGIGRSIEPMLREGVRPAVLTNSDIRRVIRKLIELEYPRVAVLSYEELPPDLRVQPLGRATLEDVEAA